MAISAVFSCRLRSAKLLLALTSALALPAAHAADCQPERAVAIAGDVPAAISYDVFVGARPVVARRLARLIAAQQVKMLREGTVVCEIADDGVSDPSAVLVRLPHGTMNYWVKRWDVEPVSGADAARL
jgi:hypothetical protein